MAESTTPGAFINEVREGVRQEVERDYAGRLADVREALRYERATRDDRDAARICEVREESAARLAEYRRGRWYHLGAVVASAAAGLAAGVVAQRSADLRVRGVPAMALMGVPGVIVGAVWDDSMAARASVAVGGAMFGAGAVAYALLNPETP